MRERRPPFASLAVLRADAFVSIGATLRDGFATLRVMPVLRAICLLSILTAFAGVPAFQMWQPRLQTLAGEGPWLLGWVWAFLNLAVIAGSALVPRVLRRWGRAPALAVSYAWRALTLGAAGLATSFTPAEAGFLVQEIGIGFSEPVLQAWVNDHATPAQRATVLSLRSMTFTLGGATGLVCLGWLARETSIATVWLVSAGIYALAVPGYFVLDRVARRHERVPVEEPLRASA